MENVTAVVLLSGGLDSATVLALARAAGRTVHALSFRYGQRNAAELAAARAVARAGGVARHWIMDLDLGMYGGSALTDPALAVPRPASLEARPEGVPATYVPARNTIFLAHALALAEVQGAEEIHIGVNAVDGSGYPDTRPEYIAAFQALAEKATAGRPARIVAPLLTWSKARIIRRGKALGVDYGLTLTCYDPSEGGGACGRCESCLVRARGFAEAGLMDPAGGGGIRCGEAVGDRAGV